VDNHHFEKSLRLVISFGSLKRAQFVNALEERLKPALDKVRGGGRVNKVVLEFVFTAATHWAAWQSANCGCL
jgi:hypothetical protein